MLGKDFVITPKKSKLEILLSHIDLCLSKMKVLRKLSVQKTGRTGPG